MTLPRFVSSAFLVWALAVPVGFVVAAPAAEYVEKKGKAELRLEAERVENGQVEMRLSDKLTLTFTVEGAADKKLYCLDPKNGKERWHWRTGGKPVGAATVDEKRVYYAPLDNILWALDRQTGVMRWRAEMPVRPASQVVV